MDFEWDDAKELANRNRHGVDFSNGRESVLGSVRDRIR